MLATLAFLRQFVPALIDILLIAFILYRIYIVLRGTRIGQAAQLLAWTMGAAFVAELLRLHTLVWLLDRFWLWLVVLLIILFQEDIKQSVSRIAYRSRFFGASPVEMRRLIGEVVEAITRLSLRGEGGVLVIERDDALDDLVESGVRIEGLFSHDLLLAIYAEDSPLRDGAVLIRNRRIIAASTLLPVPDEGSHSATSLGFRHLSSLKLSQEADAVVVVVSAETGTISAAVDGKWQRQLDREKLEELLTDYLMLGTNRSETS